MTGPEHMTTDVKAAPAGRNQGRSENRLCLKDTLRRFMPVFSSAAVGPLLAAIPLSLCLILFPQVALNTSWDGSWSAVLNQAHESRMQFGTQIVFPYGPLGYLLIPYYWPSAFWGRLLFMAALNFATSAGVCLVAWRLNFWWRLLSIGMFLLVTANIDYGVADFLLNVGLLCFGLLCLLEEHPRLTMSVVVLASFAVTGALAKFSALLIAVLTIGAVSVEWFLRSRRLPSLALAGGCILAGILGWMLLGQDLSHLHSYIAHGLWLSDGYDRTMGLDAPALVSICGWTLAALALQLVFVGSAKMFESCEKNFRSRRGVVAAWVLGFLFMTWKHGFVRADAHHVVYFVGFVAILAPLLPVLNRAGDEKSTGQSALTLATCMLGLLTLQFRLEPQYLDPQKPFHHLARNLSALTAPDGYFEQMNSSLKTERVRARLPRIAQTIGSKPVDVFGNHQAFVALNGFNLKPRPVFQSYAAYSAALMNLNESSYLSDEAPRFVLFRLDPIDQRFPPLEDARLLRLLLFNYDFAGEEGPFILLKSRNQTALATQPERAGGVVVPKLTVLDEGILRPGQRLNLARFGETNLWLEIRPEPTLVGRLRQALYRPARLSLRVWGSSSELSSREFRAPAPMLSAGFVASPLFTKTGDVENACRACGFVRPSAYALEFGNEGRLWWKNAMRFRISKMETGSHASTLVSQVKNEAKAKTD